MLTTEVFNCKYGWLGVDGSNSFRIGVAGTERMRVTDAGKVGIGTLQVQHKLLDVTANVIVLVLHSLLILLQVFLIIIIPFIIDSCSGTS